MTWIQSTLERWQGRLEGRLHILDQPLVAEKFVHSLPSFALGEKQAVLDWVRERVECHFDASAGPLLPLSFPDSWPPVNLDVAFWVRGELRASAILAENLPLTDALEQCTMRALHDGRFRPLEADELAHLRIELTFFGPWESLQRENVERFPIYPDHGYVATLGGVPRAWYLPMVHNALRFDTLPDLVASLLTRKGGLSSADARRAELFHFTVLGFMEGAEGGVLDLAGPLVKVSEAVDSNALLETSLAWLLRQEISPGFFRAKQQIARYDTQTIDWVRIGFAAATLAEARTRLDRDECRLAAQRAIAYLERELAPALFVSREAKCLAAVYAGLASYQLGETEGARRWLERAESYCMFDRLSPITALLAGKLFVWLGQADEARALFERHYREWEHAKDTVQLALYPELLPLALALFEKTGDQSYRERAEAIGDWHVARQSADGSFPFAPGSPRAPYLRGSGKILEVLACFPERYEEIITRGFRFATSLQYTEDSSYHIPHAQLAEFLGGFRHDAFNREAWIDAAGHVILALVRMRARNRER